MLATGGRTELPAAGTGPQTSHALRCQAAISDVFLGSPPRAMRPRGCFVVFGARLKAPVERPVPLVSEHVEQAPLVGGEERSPCAIVLAATRSGEFSDGET